MRVWIDLANSPHPILFGPLVRRLDAAGAEAVVTVRDHAQTLALARERWPQAIVVGGPSPASRVGKARSAAARVRELVAWARPARPDVALSHNSYAQLLAARVAGIPSVTAMDFEHQPANHLAFRAATRILLPSVIPATTVRRQGAPPRKVIRYPGLKEELYLADFDPDRDVLRRLGAPREPGTVLVVARTPPAGALYHRLGNPLFAAALGVLCRQEHVRCVVLARTPQQREEIRSLGLRNCVLPGGAVDARSLMREADLVLGAGGTMTREAALLGVPTRSVFAGPRPAVDASLEERGMLRRLSDPAELADLGPRQRDPVGMTELRARAQPIEEAFVAATTQVAGTRRSPG